MPEIELTGPTWVQTSSPDLSELKRLILELPDEYWMEGNGQAQSNSSASPRKTNYSSRRTRSSAFLSRSLAPRSIGSRFTTVLGWQRSPPSPTSGLPRSDCSYRLKTHGPRSTIFARLASVLPPSNGSNRPTCPRTAIGRA